MKICLKQRAESMIINENHWAACWMNVKKDLEDGVADLVPSAEDTNEDEGGEDNE